MCVQSEKLKPSCTRVIPLLLFCLAHTHTDGEALAEKRAPPPKEMAAPRKQHTPSQSASFLQILNESCLIAG